LHIFTYEEIEFIEQNVKNRSTSELTELFNNHFSLNLKVSQIVSFKHNHKLSSGIDCRFLKGNVPYNKGKKGFGGYEPTQFKKGNIPHNHKPVGTERVTRDGYVEVKIAESRKWKAKHILIYEQHNGIVPKGSVVIFGDGNNRNLNINNLICVSRQQLLLLNKRNLIQADAELTRTGIIIADLYQKIHKRKGSC